MHKAKPPVSVVLFMLDDGRPCSDMQTNGYFPVYLYGRDGQQTRKDPVWVRAQPAWVDEIDAINTRPKKHETLLNAVNLNPEV